MPNLLLQQKSDKLISFIGNDFHSQLIIRNTKISQDKNIMATESKFGRLLSANFPENPSNITSYQLYTAIQ